MECAVPLMFQSIYSFKSGDWDLAFILVHVKYRMYTHFTIHALLHIEAYPWWFVLNEFPTDWELTASSRKSLRNDHSRWESW